MLDLERLWVVRTAISDRHFLLQYEKKRFSTDCLHKAHKQKTRATDDDHTSDLSNPKL